MTKKIIHLLILLHAKGIGRVHLLRWMAEFGTLDKIIDAGWRPATRLLFEKWKVGDYEKDLEAAERAGVSLISYQCESYPFHLKNLADFPLLLYVKGTLPSAQKSIAMVGTRNASLYGKLSAEQIAIELARSKVCVISGLARGIDTASHQGALGAQGVTIAILGSGISHIYPQENKILAEQIAAEGGALISEYPMFMAPAAGLFPRRNRIISGLSEGICLIESPLKGGSMLTMQLGMEQNKKLFALPGRIDWPSFAGNHNLIKTNKAQLIENGADLLEYLKIAKNKEVKQSNPCVLSLEEEAFLNKMPQDEKTIEQLVLLTQLPVMQLNVLLMRLVLKKVIRELPGKIYKRM